MSHLKWLYYDTVGFFEPALIWTYGFVGDERFLLGSDYSHVIGDIRDAITSIEKLKIPREDKQLIYSGNILRFTHRNS